MHISRGCAGSLERAIVIDGHTYGTWKRTVTARSVTVLATLSGPLGAAQRDELERAVRRFGRFLQRDASLEVRHGL
ncbi:MAG TPA: crosslink repair DNA glycosylase YcaQ family protein [Euzebyales bacterium]|nr:crosslink repair DNA glycosylase YcaQ family protein [Euzebyales bacterium]